MTRRHCLPTARARRTACADPPGVEWIDDSPHTGRAPGGWSEVNDRCNARIYCAPRDAGDTQGPSGAGDREDRSATTTGA